MTHNISQIEHNVREGKRLLHMSEFERCNERAADRKADRWLSYVPLTPDQLSNGGSVDDWMVVATDIVLPGQPDRRVTFKMPVWFTPLLIVKRPTEQAALNPRYAPEIMPITPIAERPEQRWCIYCQTRHPLEDFVQSKRYLNHYSYACKRQLRELRRRPWHFANTPLDSDVRISIEKPLTQRVKTG